jgi:hypothetical protein
MLLRCLGDQARNRCQWHCGNRGRVFYEMSRLREACGARPAHRELDRSGILIASEIRITASTSAAASV